LGGTERNLRFREVRKISDLPALRKGPGVHGAKRRELGRAVLSRCSAVPGRWKYRKEGAKRLTEERSEPRESRERSECDLVGACSDGASSARGLSEATIEEQ